MDSTQLAKLTERCEQIHEKWREAISALENMEVGNGEKFDASLLIPDIELSTDDLNTQIEVLIANVDSLSKSPSKSFLFAPPMAYRKLLDALDKSIDAINELETLAQAPLKSFNSESLQGTRLHPQQRTRQISINFVEKFAAIARHLDDAFVRVGQLKEVSESGHQSANLDALVEGIRRAEDHAKTYFTNLKDNESLINAALSSAIDSSQVIEGLEKKSQSLFKSFHEKSAKLAETEKELLQTVEAISDITDTAAELKKKVDVYQDRFDKFQANIDAHEASLQKGQNEQKSLLEKIGDIEELIETQSKQASDMLANATVAGLASSFGSTRDDLNRELTWARRVFYFSIFVLVLLSVPMLLYIMPGIDTGGSAYKPNGNGLGNVLTQILARASILLPGFLFVAFASRRHSSLFRLREHYVYKYNMAVSVEGFKQQAPEIAGAIAGTTFYELLTRNPADAMDGGPKTGDGGNRTKHNPLAESVKRVLAKDQEAG